MIKCQRLPSAACTLQRAQETAASGVIGRSHKITNARNPKPHLETHASYKHGARARAPRRWGEAARHPCALSRRVTSMAQNKPPNRTMDRTHRLDRPTAIKLASNQRKPDTPKNTRQGKRIRQARSTEFQSCAIRGAIQVSRLGPKQCRATTMGASTQVLMAPLGLPLIDESSKPGARLGQ